MILIFMEGEGDEIKSKQASKRDRTLTENYTTQQEHGVVGLLLISISWHQKIHGRSTRVKDVLRGP